MRSVGANRNHSANCINASSSNNITLRRPNRKYQVSQRKFAHVATKCLGLESLISMFESKMRNCICVYSNRLQVFWDFSWISETHRNAPTSRGDAPRTQCMFLQLPDTVGSMASRRWISQRFCRALNRLHRCSQRNICRLNRFIQRGF
jgi:hypothetical protein